MTKVTINKNNIDINKPLSVGDMFYSDTSKFIYILCYVKDEYKFVIIASGSGGDSSYVGKTSLHSPKIVCGQPHLPEAYKHFVKLDNVNINF